MTSPSFSPDASIEDLAEIAELDGKMRQQGIDDHIDLAIMYEHMLKKVKYENDDKLGYGDEELNVPTTEMPNDV
jgi:hypothetical protein